MKINSISVKLFSIIVGAFLCSTVSILLIADKSLTDIIDSSKNALYVEKVDSIHTLLQQHHERLKKTGLIDAYIDDFKRSTVKELQRAYYSRKQEGIYPFIIDYEGNIVLHPTLTGIVTGPGAEEITNRLLAEKQGDFNLAFHGKIKHYTFRHFPEWQWVIGYAVPLDIKYAEAKKFRSLLIAIMTGVTLFILFLLIPVIARFTKPITRLTKAAQSMAAGDLDQEIQIYSNDEVGILAHSFQDMRVAIKQTISELERENRERKNAEDALANEKEQLAVTLISIGEGVITTDLQGRIVLINKIAEQLTGWDHSMAVGRDLIEVFKVYDPQTGKPDHDIATRITTTISATTGERKEQLKTKTGQELIIASNGAPIKDARQKTIGAILVFRDISQQIKTEQELLKSRKLESIGVLAGGIAHDFNNILAIILGNIDLILLDNSLPESARTRLSNMQKASLRAQGLTQQLLTFSKGGAPIRAVSSLENLIKDSADFVLHGRNVASRFDISQELWAAAVDKGQISQVIQNIVINGCEAMADGGTIVIAARNVTGGEELNAQLSPGQKYVALSIADSGKGISQENIDKIFDPYFSTKTEGNGLGLAICHSIISKHEGQISVESHAETGTVFTIYLPASDTLPTAEAQAKDIVPGTMNATILIMDDEEAIRDLGKMMLEEMGYATLAAADGVEALELYKKHKEQNTPIDLVIMDLTIPGGMGGKDAVQKLLNYDRDAKAIVCSGYSNDPIMADPASYGFQAAISKPYKYATLAAVIRKSLMKTGTLDGHSSKLKRSR